MPCSRCGMTQHRKQVSTITCTNKSTCDFARANLHDVEICDDQSDARRGTTDTKRLGVDEKPQMDNQQQHTARRSTRAAQCQAQRAADKDTMIVDPPQRMQASWTQALRRDSKRRLCRAERAPCQERRPASQPQYVTRGAWLQVPPPSLSNPPRESQRDMDGADTKAAVANHNVQHR